MLLLIIAIVVLIVLAIVILLNIVPIAIGLFYFFGLMFILSPPKHGDRHGKRRK